MKSGAGDKTAKVSCAMVNGTSCDMSAKLGFSNPNGFDLFQTIYVCDRCHHGISLPALGDVAVLYEGRESQDFQPTNRGMARWIKEIAFRRSARRLLKQIGSRPNSLIDYGCGSGQFTRILGEELGEGEVIGSDYFPAPPTELNGRPYIGYTALTDSRVQYEVLTAFHVLEHDETPSALMARFADLVREGGTIVVEVPNVACVWGRVFGTKWDAWYQPYHRHHFSRKSLQAIVEGAGFEVLSCHDETVPTMGRTLANLFGKKNTLGFLLAGILLHPVQVLGERLTGEGSALRVVARKPRRQV